MHEEADSHGRQGIRHPPLQPASCISCGCKDAAAAESRFRRLLQNYEDFFQLFMYTPFVSRSETPSLPRSEIASTPASNSSAHLQMTAATVGNPGARLLHASTVPPETRRFSHQPTATHHDTRLISSRCALHRAPAPRAPVGSRAEGAVDTHARRGNTARGQATGCLPPYHGIPPALASSGKTRLALEVATPRRPSPARGGV